MSQLVPAQTVAGTFGRKPGQWKQTINDEVITRDQPAQTWPTTSSRQAFYIKNRSKALFEPIFTFSTLQKLFLSRLPGRGPSKNFFLTDSNAGDGQKTFFEPSPEPATRKKLFFGRIQDRRRPKNSFLAAAKPGDAQKTFFQPSPEPATPKKIFFGRLPDRRQSKNS